MKAPHPEISVVIPVYQAEKSLRVLRDRLFDSLGRITQSFEIILVDDGSTDRSWAMLRELAHEDHRIRAFRLSRNFGQQNCITAGMDQVDSDWVVIMDCDLQDPPEHIPELYRKALQEKLEVVIAVRKRRKDAAHRILGSWLFAQAFAFLTGDKINFGIGNFRICSRRVADNFNRMREEIRVFGFQMQWLGFQVGYLDIEHAPRHSGTSTYNTRKLMSFGIYSLLAHSNRPLKLSIALGVLISMGAVLFGILLLAEKFLGIGIVSGWTSVMVSLYFLFGVLLLNLGVLGIYLGKVFDQVRGRPIYVISEEQDFAPPASVSRLT